MKKKHGHPVQEDAMFNAQITKTHLGREDHGIPSFMLTICIDSSAMGFGGYDLRGYGMSPIMDILDAVKVARWEDLPGTFVRVDVDRLIGPIDAIGHITEDRWVRKENWEWTQPKEIAGASNA